MKNRFAVLPLLMVIAALPACTPKRIPDISFPPVPPQQLVRALAERRDAFRGLKALASVRIARKERVRSFETVGILLQAQQKLRMEAFGPFGESLVTLVWDGRDVLVAQAGDARVINTGRFGMERLIGAAEPVDLAAALSGNIPARAEEAPAKAYCSREGICVIDLRGNDQVRRLWIRQETSAGGPAPVELQAQELYRSGRLQFRVRYADHQTLSGYGIPMKIMIEHPERNTVLTVEYSEAELAESIPQELFSLSGREAGDP